MTDNDDLTPLVPDEDGTLPGDEAPGDDAPLALEPVATGELARVYAALLARAGETQVELRLDATRRACELLGDIHLAAPAIMLTGTNGKTSTARMVDALLSAHNLRVGRFTSPHLTHVTERISVDGEEVGHATFARVYDEIEPVLALVDQGLADEGRPGLTFFEALTVLALAVFADAPVDAMVLEVGMGGEWDSTNVADGGVAVFTPISLDHQGRLGDTITEIARTKAGIIKPGAAVVSAAQPADAAAEIAAAAAERDATVYAEPDAFAVTADHMAVGGRLISVRGINGQYDDLPLAIAGEYQAHNAALALAAVEAFFGGERELLTENVEAGIAEALSPGRLELVGANPAVVVDAAHNPHGAAHLAQAVNETYAFDQLTLVLAVLEDKNVEGIVRPLANIADRIIVTQSDSPRAIAAYDLAEMVRDVLGEELSEQKQVRVIDRSDEALATARAEAAAFELGEDEYGLPQSAGVLVTGSTTLIGEAYALAHEQGWKQAPSEGEE
jgi:dihydrofolate synthase/folylpolyglutamate synthase